MELSNRALSRYAGWVPRTPEYWRWAIFARPGVHAADIVILEDEGTILAYGALHQDGAVLDFVVDPSRSLRNRSALAARLVATLEERARARQLDMLYFSLPVSDRALDRVLRRAGYIVERQPFFGLGILNPCPLFESLLSARKAQLVSVSCDEIVLELTPGAYSFLLLTRLRIQLRGGIRVDEANSLDTRSSSCVIRTDLSALTELVFLGVSVDALLHAKRIEVFPPNALPDARRVLHALSISREWYVPLSDAF